MDTNINHGKQSNCLASKEGRGLGTGLLNNSSYHPHILEAYSKERRATKYSIVRVVFFGL